ncbi:DNA-3-methyladenine glycosylase [Alicyclobacillus contaminans]|uniref:DNA-3-methyladenine glycosylase I n=1 Tax=Alicyclobacillus contaminans TaxID=392016 RepID=UPI00041112A0|nr:DNA-3-methyladenine glycosylase I [Alicyclobacillus contaminans]GMA49670.1 DNA-3-methyladenine glycosylase [Alicyclobacillus contaminans]
MQRCGWVNEDPLYVAYHDEEWGVPVRDDRKLFEFLILEGAQAGLSWYTILRKREHYRAAFDQFDVDRVAEYGDDKVAQLLSPSSGIVRNRLKVASAIRNARCFQQVRAEYGSFSNYLWGFVDGRPVVNHWPTLQDVPASTNLSDTISKDLKHRGFNFVGTTIVYSYLQAVGVVMDHIVPCFRHAQLARE